MQVTLTGKQIDVTPPLNDYVRNKLVRMERYFDQVMMINVILRVDKLEHFAEASIGVPGGGKPIFAEANAHDMYAAIDVLADKLYRQVTRYKEKLQDHHRAEAVALAP